MNETEWDKLLKIRTTGRDDSRSDQHCYPYEPTPYPVLERLAGSGLITKKNVLVDYGCGKGRVDFYLAWQAGCRCIGVEYDERIWQTAVDNQQNAVSGSKTEFRNLRAEVCPVPEEADRFYFFNPFPKKSSSVCWDGSRIHGMSTRGRSCSFSITRQMNMSLT